MEDKTNFIKSLADGSAGLREVGGKGASLARIGSQLGGPYLPVFP